MQNKQSDLFRKIKKNNVLRICYILRYEIGGSKFIASNCA